MTIQQLRYFLALCEDLNYTHTAGRMYLSRQALRLSIAALEEELCGKLFVNNRNHLALTEKGERFRAQAAPVVQQFNALCQQAYKDIQSAPLRLGISVLLGHFVGSMVINSLALRIFYGYPWATLAVRIPNALILAAVNTVLLRILLENRTLMKMVKK